MEDLWKCFLCRIRCGDEMHIFIINALFLFFLHQSLFSQKIFIARERAAKMVKVSIYRYSIIDAIWIGFDWVTKFVKSKNS